MEINKIETECSCGCSTLRIEKIENFTDEELHNLNLPREKQFDYSFQFYISKFYSKQEGIFSIIKRRLKLIWYIIRGKEYLLEDLNFTEDQVKELTRNLQDVIK
ncbi:hypothetical protein [uncultured Clostridium sp.]|uniref:hypothetical protein n=1 Tax=uncultured Clostridium sp. TaxID=59620 RepID=UPI002624B7A6|nr:hypothetical protein [uncultured Clostridium sp.]